MLEWVDATGVSRHFLVPADEVALEQVAIEVSVRDVVDFVPEFPGHDVGGIAPAGHDISDEVFGDSNGFFVSEKIGWRFESELGAERVVHPIAWVVLVGAVFQEVAKGEDAGHDADAILSRIVDDMVKLCGVFLVEGCIEIHRGFVVRFMRKFRPVEA